MKAVAPNWHGAAAELVGCLGEIGEPDERVRLLDKLCQRLDGGLYPAFLQMLLEIDLNGEAAAKAIVAETVAHALTTGRMPSGKVRAWGASQSPTGGVFEQSRNLGPIEYLCAWYMQPSDLPPLTRAAFDTGLSALIRLFSTADDGLERYCDKLVMDANHTIGGSLTNQTQDGLRELARCMRSRVSAEESVAAFLAAAQSSGSLMDLQKNPFT